MAASSFHSSNLQRLFMISSSFFFHSKTRTINHLLSDLCLSTSTIRSESTRRVQLSFPRKLLFSCQAKLDFEADESFNINVVSPALLTTDKEMATQVAASSFNGNVKKALAGLRRINLEGLRWRVFDAKDQVLGRLASRISTVIQGKDKPTYTPNRDDGDMCIVLNAKDICVTGRKLTDKVYHWHTEYVGNLKERSLKDQMAKDPTEVIRKAVLRMLPRNKLRDDRDRKLRIFAGGEHPFGDRPLEPYIMPPRKVRELRPRARRAMIRAQKKAEQQQNGDDDSRNGRKREEKLEVIA